MRHTPFCIRIFHKGAVRSSGQPRPDRARSSCAVRFVWPLQIGGRSGRSFIWRVFHDFEAGSSLRSRGQRKSCYVAAGGTIALAIAGEIIWQQAIVARHKKFYFGATLRAVRPTDDWRHLRSRRSGNPPLHRRAYCHDAGGTGPIGRDSCPFRRRFSNCRFGSWDAANCGAGWAAICALTQENSSPPAGSRPRTPEPELPRWSRRHKPRDPPNLATRNPLYSRG